MKSLIKLILLYTYFCFSFCSFQTSIFKQLNEEFINENLIISPLSAYQILSLTANGSDNKTLKQFLLALGNQNLDELNKINADILNLVKDFTTIETANAIMTKFTPKQNFLDIALKYESTIETLKSAAQVNNWCNLKTHGKITKIIDELNPNTVMILLNAIYFKGVWLKEFNETNTLKKEFFNLNDESKATKTDLMFIKDYFNYYEDKEVQIVELPYTKDSMSAVVILPKKEININKFISELDDEKIPRLLKRMHKEMVKLDLPKFELEFSSTFNKALQKLGVVDAFDEGSADFTGMRNQNDIYIEKVIQKTYLKVDEKGTEAAGITSVVINTKSLPITYQMRVDRPFLFMLRNKNLPQDYEMLFMSKIEKL